MYMERDVRNHFEHFDERIDQWYDDSLQRGSLMWIDSNIGPANSMIKMGGKPIVGIRHFDPNTGKLIIVGDEFHLPTLAKDLTDLLATANRLLEELNQRPS